MLIEGIQMGEESNLLGYLGAAGGIAIGWIMSSIIQLDVHVRSLLSAIFSGSQRAGGPNVNWQLWAGWLFAELLWGFVAVWGYRRYRASDGALNGVLMGAGVGGVIETGMQIPA